MLDILKRLTILILFLAILLTGARVAGSLHAESNAPNMSFADEQCSPQPCWRGIRPGETSLAQTRAILKDSAVADDEYRICYQIDGCWSFSIRSWSADPASPLGMLTIQPAKDSFLLWQAVKQFGDPLTSILCLITAPSNGDIGTEVKRPLMVAYLTFKGNIKVVAYNPRDPMLRRIDPMMDVYRFYYQSGYDIFTPRWKGFSQQQRLGCNMG